MEKIYLDTNQLYYIRRIAEEAQGADFGSYEWARQMFPNKPQLVHDIRALCYIVALQYEWDLDFSSSDASYSEICRSTSKRAQATQEAWILFAEGLKDDRRLRRVPFLPHWPVSGPLSFAFIEDADDRVILRHVASEGADAFLTSDEGILKHKDSFARSNVVVMRPSEWLNTFLQNTRENEDAVDWLERVLFGIGEKEHSCHQ